MPRPRRLSFANWPEGVDRKVYASLDSTNSEAGRIAPGLTRPTWILAHAQTAARGRRGRSWANPEGNFAASLVMRGPGPMEQWALRSFVAALALAEALDGLTGRPELLALKWPNDVLLQGGKLAGILLETSGAHLTIGIGVNLVAAPSAAEVEEHAVPPTCLLGATGLRVTPEDLLTPLAARFALHEASLTTYGFAPIRTAWLARAAKLGQSIRARIGNTIEHGVFRDVDAQGNLVLETSKGLRAIPAAEVYF
ncbi:MAG: BirA family biotin operon repressor/biotin-[acetyl-CoA-carboxylase] ligase [Sulfitobacter sp.]